MAVTGAASARCRPVGAAPSAGSPGGGRRRRGRARRARTRRRRMPRPAAAARWARAPSASSTSCAAGQPAASARSAVGRRRRGDPEHAPRRGERVRRRSRRAATRNGPGRPDQPEHRRRAVGLGEQRRRPPGGVVPGGRLGLEHHDARAPLGQRPRRRRPGDPGADDDHVGRRGQVHLRRLRSDCAGPAGGRNLTGCQICCAPGSASWSGASCRSCRPAWAGSRAPA